MTDSSGKIQVRRISATIGAEISGVDLHDLDGDTFAAIHRTLLEREVVFFRDTGLTDEEHMKLALRFGQPGIFPMFEVMGATEPTFQVIEDGPDSPPAADYWHTDVTWSAEPPKYALLRAEIIPEFGGDTLWGSMTAAYEALSPAMQKLLDGLVVLHDNTSFIEGLYTKMGAEQVKKSGIDQRLRDAHPGVNHPLVRTHPETGRRAILFGGGFMRHIVGVSEDENQLLMDFLRRHIDNPHFHCRWQWRPGDLAIWDERSTVHRALSDHFPQRRTMHRCVVEGDRPYFDDNVVAA